MNKVIINKDRCKGCGLCIEACPRKILAIDEAELNAKGYYPATVTDMSKCIACAFCATMCPDAVITVIKE